MLTETHLHRYAEVLLWGLRTARRGKFKKGDIVMVRHHMAATRLAELLQARLLELGLQPVIQLIPTHRMEKNLFDLGKNHQLGFWPPGEDVLYHHLNGSIFLYAPASITHLSGTDPKKIARHALSRKPLRDILDRRDAAGLFGWTLCMLPTEELAQHAQLDFKTYTQQIVKACRLNRNDPVGEWQEIYKQAQQVKKWLNSLPVQHFQVESANLDLKITPGQHRQWVGLSGHNIPSFELFTSPDWRGSEGIYFSNLPSYRSGNLVRDVRLKFKNGNVVDVKAAQGESFTKLQLSMDRGAGRIGEFSLTDKRFSKINRFMANTLFDENFGGLHGNCHIALGSSYADTYAGDPTELSHERKQELGFNDSALHWDLVNTENKRVTACLKGGRRQVIYENGLFGY